MKIPVKVNRSDRLCAPRVCRVQGSFLCSMQRAVKTRKAAARAIWTGHRLDNIPRAENNKIADSESSSGLGPPPHLVSSRKSPIVTTTEWEFSHTV